MEPEKTLLEQISEKEKELRIQTDMVYREAETIVTHAREEASHIIEEAETEGKKRADDICEQKLKQLHQEIAEIKQEGLKKAIVVQKQGEQNLQKAIKKIIDIVVE